MGVVPEVPNVLSGVEKTKKSAILSLKGDVDKPVMMVEYAVRSLCDGRIPAEGAKVPNPAVVIKFRAFS